MLNLIVDQLLLKEMNQKEFLKVLSLASRGNMYIYRNMLCNSYNSFKRKTISKGKDLGIYLIYT